MIMRRVATADPLAGKVASVLNGFTRWLDDLQKEYVVYTNVKSLLTIFLPALVAVLSRFV